MHAFKSCFSGSKLLASAAQLLMGGNTENRSLILNAEPWIKELGLADQQLAQLAEFMRLLMDHNRRVNLTAIREPEAIARLHFADSLAAAHLLPWLPVCRKGADIGSGAGFPVVPLAIYFPRCEWFAIDSVAKKADFIREAAQVLGLKNLEVVTCRAEHFARTEHRGSFDVVTARAVGPFISLCEVGLPLLREGGRLVLFKTEASQSEVERAYQALGELGGTLEASLHYRLTGDRQDRVLYVVQRSGPVSEKFPRDHAKPFKQPLA